VPHTAPPPPPVSAASSRNLSLSVC
jgi:hypothetical protein